MAGQHGDRGAGDTGDPPGLAEGRRAHLLQALHHLARESRQACENEAFRNAANLLPPLALHVGGLTTKISLVLELGLQAGEINRLIAWIDREADLSLLDEGAQAYVWTLKRSRRGDALP